MLRGGARVYEGLSDDRQNGVDAVGHLNVQNELRVLQDVDPEPKRETGGRKTWVRERERGERVVGVENLDRITRCVPHLLVFQIWTVSGSSIPCFSAMSSKKSKKNLTAIGGGRFVLSIATNTSSTNFCNVP